MTSLANSLYSLAMWPIIILYTSCLFQLLFQILRLPTLSSVLRSIVIPLQYQWIYYVLCLVYSNTELEQDLEREKREKREKRELRKRADCTMHYRLGKRAIVLKFYTQITLSSWSLKIVWFPVVPQSLWCYVSNLSVDHLFWAFVSSVFEIDACSLLPYTWMTGCHANAQTKVTDDRCNVMACNFLYFKCSVTYHLE